MASQTISPSDRIRDLSEINAEVAAMIASAGQAINSLTDRPLATSSGDGEDTDMADASVTHSIIERKEAFTEHTKNYYTHLQAVVARLRRHAYALEEAGIIAPEAPVLSTGGQERQPVPGQVQQRGQMNTAQPQESERIVNGGLGNLDVGWLNSRGNKVGAEKESEMIEDAKKLLEVAIHARKSTEGNEGA
jgi:hypothetical protein